LLAVGGGRDLHQRVQLASVDLGGRPLQPQVEALGLGPQPRAHVVGEGALAQHRHGRRALGQPALALGHHLRAHQGQQRVQHQREQHHHGQRAPIAQRLAQLLDQRQPDVARPRDHG
jgi:hypothetical protein